LNVKVTTLVSDVPPRPAASVLVLRDRPDGFEVFMVRRHDAMAFMGGAHVFPGGRLDAQDFVAHSAWCDGLDAAAEHLSALPAREALAYHVAAARELFEEAGILFARDTTGALVSTDDPSGLIRFAKHRVELRSRERVLRDVLEEEGLRLALDAFLVAAHWVTPAGERIRFDTRFFVAVMPSAQTPSHDDSETTAGDWFTPDRAIAAAEAGDIHVPPPTWTILRELQSALDIHGVLDRARERPIPRCEPKAVDDGGRALLVLPGDSLYPEPSEPPLSSETRFVCIAGRWYPERKK
jgi:8-oxo-dGTP pyrophosphatase MutT (NUDIX family)